MKLIFFYTLDYIKRNRRSSISIMVAILMASTMLSALCGYMYTGSSDIIRSIVERSGDWHGELFDDTLGSKLEIIENFDEIETIMIKGDWMVAEINDPRRDYLIWRDANAEYWESMPEKNNILEGSIPTKTGEVALSKQYFEHHPDLKIGDAITLPIGNRVDEDGNIIDPRDRKQVGEIFVEEEKVTLTVVGKYDVATDSTLPAYTALGFLDENNIEPTDNLIVYFRFHNIRDTYKVLPEIAKAVGYEMNEYGEYILRYNTAYLAKSAVISPEQMSAISLIWANQTLIASVIIGLLTVSVFVLIIHNAFALSIRTRLHQLGIFASIGATPKQIKWAVMIEAMLLTILPLPLGIVIGQVSVAGLFNLIDKSTPAYSNHETFYVLGWQSILPAILLTLLTVWWSAVIPARKIAKLSPIVAIREGETENLKKPHRYSLGKLFGLSGELAANALQARKKSYRTSTISLTLSFLILAVFLCITTANTASEAIYQTTANKWAEYDVLVTLSSVESEQDFTAITEIIRSQENLKSDRWYNQLNTAAWLPPDGFSEEFYNAGGFEEAENILMSSAPIPFERDGERRVFTTIIGLDDITFEEYCTQLDIDKTPFYESDKLSAILYNSIEDITISTKKNPVSIPYLNSSKGDTLALSEKTRDDWEGDYSFPIEVAAIADILPPLGVTEFGGRYYATLFMPMSRVNDLATSFSANRVDYIKGVLCANQPEQITNLRIEVEQICESYFGSGDYSLLDEDEYYKLSAESDKILVLIFGFVVGLMAIIGLSNAYFTIQGTLSARRREFAMLRSIGISPKGLKKMLLFEAILLGVKPILISLPITLILQGVFLNINEITLLEWLPFAPWKPMFIYIIAVMAVTITTYLLGITKILNENIMDMINLDII